MIGDYSTLSLIDLISERHKELRNKLNDKWKDLSNEELSSSETYILAIVEKGEFTMAEIARRIGISRQGVHKIIKGLIERGYVEFKEKPDNKRDKSVVLTQHGEKCCREINKIKIEIEKEIEDNIGDEDKEELRRILCRNIIK